MEYILLLAGGIVLVTAVVSTIIPAGSEIYSAIREYNAASYDLPSTTYSPPSTADVSVDLTSCPSSATSGNTYSLTVRICNNGPADVGEYSFKTTNSKSSSIIPSSVTDPSGIPAGDCKTHTISWTPNTAGTHVITAQLTSSTPSDPDSSNNSDSCTVLVSSPPKPDISVSFSSVPSSPQTGNTYTISIQVCNAGSSSGSYTLTLSDPNATISPPSYSGTLSPSSCTTRSFSWTPSTSGTHTLTASASTPNDSNPSNNTATRTISVSSPPPPPTTTDFSLTLTSCPSSATTGNSYTIITYVCNNGSISASYTVSLSDPNASISSPQSSTLSPGSCRTHSFTWTPNTSGTHTITATLSSSSDSNPSNNSDSCTVSVSSPPPDLSLSLDCSGISNPETGNTYAFTVRVCNTGSGSANSYSFSVSDSASSSITPSSVNDPAGIAPGDCETYNISWTPTTAGTHTITAQLTSSTPSDPDSSNNSDSCTLNVSPSVVTLYCDSCASCTQALINAKNWAEANGTTATVYLTKDISATCNCISLGGGDYGSVTFDGQGHTITGNNNCSGIKLGGLMSGLKVRNLTITRFNYGIYLNARNCYFRNVTVTNNGDAGIYIIYGGNNWFLSLSLSGNTYGIYVDQSGSNVFTDVDTSDLTYVRHGSNNRFYFVRGSGGFYLSHSSGNLINSATISSPGSYGIHLYYSYSNNIRGVSISGASVDGIKVEYEGSNTFSNITISNSGEAGIVFFDSSNNTFSTVTIDRCGFWGINQSQESSGNRFNSLRVTNCRTGIYVGYNTLYVSNAEITNNSTGVEISEDATFYVDATSSNTRVCGNSTDIKIYFGLVGCSCGSGKLYYNTVSKALSSGTGFSCTCTSSC